MRYFKALVPRVSCNLGPANSPLVLNNSNKNLDSYY